MDEAWEKYCIDNFGDSEAGAYCADCAISDYKASVKALIANQREGTDWLGESKEKALDMLDKFLDEAKPPIK